MKKQKLTRGKQRQLEADYRQHNKCMAQTNNLRMQFASLDDYIAWRYGARSARSFRGTSHTVDMTKTGVHRRVTDAERVPSLMASSKQLTTESTTQFKVATARKDTPAYSGEEIVGIATSHKSNLLPVGRGTDPKIFSTMRRGDGEIS